MCGVNGDGGRGPRGGAGGGPVSGGGRGRWSLSGLARRYVAWAAGVHRRWPVPVRAVYALCSIAFAVILVGGCAASAFCMLALSGVLPSLSGG